MKILLIGMILSFMSCTSLKSTKTYQGEIYVKLIDVGSLYGASKEILEKVKNANTQSNIAAKNKKDKALTKYFELLVKHNLLDKPYFKLKLNDSEVVNVFSSESNYLKIKPLIDNLNRDKEKIKVTFRGDKKEKGIYFADEIITIDKIKGKTEWEK